MYIIAVGFWFINSFDSIGQLMVVVPREQRVVVVQNV
jgi:hypothetical protein